MANASDKIKPISLSELNQYIAADIVADKSLQNVWTIAETNDLRISGGHCYLELIEKDSAGKILARLRTIIWASQFARLNAEFFTATGQHLKSDMKVMMKVSVNFHPVFGLSAVVSDINPDYTCGDIMRRRLLIIQRLKDEGVFDLNRSLPWPEAPLNIAIVSAKGAAGYGDFINQLYSNNSKIRFLTKLFPAVMQGQSAPSSIIEALELVDRDNTDFDCVVIIRGGGATGDLSCFDDYNLAANIAQFPLPIIVGIGHERDRTVLDDIAAVSVKTPTAAAEWLVNKVDFIIRHVRDLASEIFRISTEKISSSLQQLAYYQGLIPSLALNRIGQAKTSLDSAIPDIIRQACVNNIRRQSDKLDAYAQLLEALSPESVLKRGYSITRINGHAVTDASTVAEGDTISTLLYKGTIHSVICNQSKN